ncbi:MAG TPA: patatin-like phospholipase family protein [Nitrospiraceae bacterium]|nr:patatin-like phospholipase family protein [Nitrospiraceae bacterium]
MTSFATIILFETGCAHYPVNAKLTQYEPARPSISAPTRSDELLLVVSFSGGGTRAATLAYGVLEAMARVEVPAPPYMPTLPDGRSTHRLFDEVDIVTGVSGGSIAAAYIALRGERIFTDFRQQFLSRNVTWGLVGRLLNPINLWRLGSIHFSRTDLEAEYFDNLLFHGATYKDLDPQKGPDLFIQATDIVDGYYFAFSRLQFGLICSDLSRFPLARAVAASASLPGPFTAITVRNYAGQCGFQEEPWMTEALLKRDVTSRAYRFARQLRTYQDWEGKPYIHLVDGGISDNLGVRGYLDYLIASGDPSRAFRQRGIEHVKRVAFIIVNAETKQSTRGWSLLEDTPGLDNIGDVSFSAMINSYNFESMELLRRMVKDWSVHRQETAQDHEPIVFYAAEVAFSALSDQKEQETFLNFPTSFDLSEEQIDRLREVAARLLYQSEDFRRLVQDLGGKLPSSLLGPSSPGPLPPQVSR